MLTIWDFFGETEDRAERAVLRRIVREWEERTGVAVRLQGTVRNASSKMCVAAPYGHGPDIIGVPHDQLRVMVSAGVLEPIPERAWEEADQWELVTAARMAPVMNGRRYGLPWSGQTVGLYYNRELAPDELFSRGAFTPWVDVIARAREIGMGWDVATLYFNYALISGAGGYVFGWTERGWDWRDLGVDSAGTIAGMEFLRDLTVGAYGVVSPSVESAERLELFVQGKLGFYLSGPWDERYFQTHSLDYGVAPIPSLDGVRAARPFAGVQVFAVSRYSAHKAEALSLLTHMTREIQLPMFRQNRSIPVLSSLLAAPDIQGDRLARAWAAALVEAEAMPNIGEMNQVWGPMGRALGAVARGKMHPARACRLAAREIRAQIARAHAVA